VHVPPPQVKYSYWNRVTEVEVGWWLGRINEGNLIAYAQYPY